MATIIPNPLITTFKGTLDSLVFVHRKDGITFARRRPSRTAPITEAEHIIHERLKLANEYVQDSWTQPDLRGAYEDAARRTGRRACDLAKADFAHPPVIHDVDLTEYDGAPGRPIRIEAVDDFGVIAVQVTIAELDGTVIERGAAAQQKEVATWIYTTQVAVSGGKAIAIVVNASDRPENTATKTVHHVLG